MIDHALFDQRLQNRSGPARSDAPASEALPASDRSNRRSQRANLSDNQSRGLLLASKAGPILESASATRLIWRRNWFWTRPPQRKKAARGKGVGKASLHPHPQIGGVA